MYDNQRTTRIADFVPVVWGGEGRVCAFTAVPLGTIYSQVVRSSSIVPLALCTKLINSRDNQRTLFFNAAAIGLTTTTSGSSPRPCSEQNTQDRKSLELESGKKNKTERMHRKRKGTNNATVSGARAGQQ